MALSLTGTILFSDPGSSPEGLTAGPLDEATGPGGGAADTVIVDTGSDEQDGTDCPEPDCPEEDVSALTTIEACKSATGFWERTVVYDWTVEKKILDSEGVDASADGSYASVELPLGETQTVQYQLVAERLVASESDVMGVRGFVRVTNTGLWPTENLRIFDHIQMSNGCGFEDVEVFEVDTSANPVLCPGESYCYAYEYEFEAEAGACYLNLAIVSITNMEAACEDSVSACAGFSIPAEPIVNEIDESARLVEEMQCPEGFECTVDDDGPWMLTDSRTIIVSVEVTNVDAPCGETFVLPNAVALTETDTCQRHTDSAVVELEYECDDEEEFTTITVEKSLDSSWARGVSYSWTVDKRVSPDFVILDQGETASVTYVITVTRTAGEITDEVEISGLITVKNTGANPTTGLAVHDTLYVTIEDDELVLMSEDIDISAMPVLAPGASYSYEYSFDVTDELLELLDVETLPESLADLSLRNVASASITNYEGHEGSAFAVEDEVTDDLPGSPELTKIDEQAVLSDLFGALPAGFTVTNTTVGPWILNDINIGTGSVMASWKVDVKNVDAECGSTFYLTNRATITASDTGASSFDDAMLTIETEDCEECGGCTLTIGYWKNHAGLGNGNQADDITPLITAAGGTIWLGTPNGADSVPITTAAQAVTYLDRDGDSSNGINRLYAQLLAAKLNILNGACDDAVDQTIAQADAFLATHSAEDWSSLTAAQQSQVNGWKDTLDDYNNGRIGPGHCE